MQVVQNVVLLHSSIHLSVCLSVRNVDVSLWTQVIRFGQKTDEIAKFSILDEKRNS